MIREERALKNLKQMCSDGRYLGSGSYVPLEVLEDFAVAIQALEQQSCEDIPTITIPVEDYIKLIEQEPRWISVSNGLPEDYQRVLVTVVNYDGYKVVRVAEYHGLKKIFQIKENHEQWKVGEKGLLAWMPLPKSYEPQESENKENQDVNDI